MKTVDMADALREGRGVTADGQTASLTLRTLGDLVLPTGRIVACDPFGLTDDEPFTRRVEPGRYPVSVNVAQFEDQERVAYAILHLNDRTPVRWEMALLAGQDPASLQDGYFFGYGVDAGTGCFIDARTALMLERRSAPDNNYNGDLLDDLEATYVPTWSWMDFVLDPATGANVIAFSSGWGDGSYPSYWGLDETGAPTCLVTDFGLFWPEDAG